MTPHAQLQRRPTAPGLFGWLGGELPLPAGLRWPDPEHAIRCEEYVEDGRYVLRAELPGFDPDKDVEVSVADGVLTIRAERHDEHREQHRSEFFYGRVTRTLVLPDQAAQDAVTATYTDGILQVVMPLTATATPGRQVPVQRQE
jgi:HSP20 family molecular chaperone IbpA